MLTPPPMPCQAVTWSIDTSAASHPGRVSAAARRAFAQWADVTGITFQWIPAGGQVGITIHEIRPGWIAYALDDDIVLGPAVTDSAPEYLTEVIGHELGHVLGIPHEGDGLMGGKVTRPTPDDAALVSRCPS